MRTHKLTITKYPNTHIHIQSVKHSQGRALSVDELSWSQTLWLSYSISCKRWIMVLYNYSHTEAQCNKVCVFLCVWVCYRKREHILKWMAAHSSWASCASNVVCLLLQVASKCERFRGVCADREGCSSLHCSLTEPKQVSGGKKRLLPLWSIWLPYPTKLE